MGFPAGEGSEFLGVAKASAAESIESTEYLVNCQQPFSAEGQYGFVWTRIVYRRAESWGIGEVWVSGDSS